MYLAYRPTGLQAHNDDKWLVDMRSSLSVLQLWRVCTSVDRICFHKCSSVLHPHHIQLRHHPDPNPGSLPAPFPREWGQRSGLQSGCGRCPSAQCDAGVCDVHSNHPHVSQRFPLLPRMRHPEHRSHDRTCPLAGGTTSSGLSTKENVCFVYQSLKALMLVNCQYPYWQTAKMAISRTANISILTNCQYPENLLIYKVEG